MHKPTLFIGSSSKMLPVANAIKNVLNDQIEVTIWNDGVFNLGESHLSSLLRGVKAFDFALLVCGADDALTKEEKNSFVPRDNVIFELGLFMGAVGSRRAFPVLVKDDEKQITLPSDLNGLNITFIDLLESMSLTAESVQKLQTLESTILDRYQNNSEFQILPSTGIAVGYYHNFVEPVCSLLANKASVHRASDQSTIAYNYFLFEILIPSFLRDANRDGATYHAKQQKLERVLVSDDKGHRPYPFFTEAQSDGSGVIKFHDYPTTLKSSDEAIDYITRDAYLSGNSPLRAAFDRRELENFERTIRLLLQTESKAISFRDRVTFRTLS